MITVTINGKEKTLIENSTLQNIIDEYDVKVQFLVVEYNFKILKQEEWNKIIIQNNDNIELITFVGGG